MEVKELIDALRICADGDIICSACPRYERSMNYGSAYCFYELMLEAAETIESQQKRIAELEAALREQEERRWIPVTERLPEKEDGSVLMTNGKNHFLSQRVLMHKVDGIDGFFIPVSYAAGSPVTHWMKIDLPKLPKEDS